MKIVVLGGYGVFGAKLADLLTRDGHDVIVAGRSLEKATALAAQFGAGALAVDRAGDLGPLWAANPDAVVDAAGPFHAYGNDPYAFARACIAQGVHYLDLADDPAFCAGITALDVEAKAAGVFALSGVSSVPAISSAAVAALADGAQIDTISTAILPGNRAPRGRSVVASILHQCGVDFDVPVDGAASPMRSWSRPARFDLGQGIVRKAWMIEVPDHRLFADAFGARSVLFRAGLELGVMNWSLAVFSWLRGFWRFPIPRWLVSFLLFVAKLLYPFGTDEGGMSVAVTLQSAEGWQRRTWRMVATGGEGPYIPAVAARVVLRDIAAVPKGARPAVAVVPLDAICAGMADLAVTHTTVTEDIEPLFARHLGADYAILPPQVRDLHIVCGPRRWAGRGSVTRGQSRLARIFAAVFRFPEEAKDIPVTVTMTPYNGGEGWERDFDGQRFRSFLRRNGESLTERFGPFTFTLGLHVQDDCLHFPVTKGRFGPIPMPRFALPKSIAREYEKDGRFHFDVALHAPFTGALVVHYKGWLERRVDLDPPLSGFGD
ncbi:Saccharopine dehydrogenase NADP binding domain-containing protein [Yoonia tamlensis]|uniref:Saccharopine dehydrogenase NADP binding domain-containing protein n=1 Tax=Yoonia tamlensis TaxID=390270 RepID=A0A1I6FXT9_9RHOB|nr:SDR family oxidoreductase [Yoonia tamlensis]SFR34724.1 Saccharopine dehydrogenase NADP binding domain-containing protein [Yoonia tamlensis]